MKRNDLFIDELIKMRVNKKYQLTWLLEMINHKYEKLNYNFHLVYMWGYKYEIVDLNDYWRIIKIWTLDFLIWFCEWFLYVKK